MTSRASWTRVTTTCAIWMRSAGIASGHAHEALLERSGSAFERVGQEPRDYPRDLPQVRPRQARLTLLGEPAQVFDDLRRSQRLGSRIRPGVRALGCSCEEELVRAGGVRLVGYWRSSRMISRSRRSLRSSRPQHRRHSRGTYSYARSHAFLTISMRRLTVLPSLAELRRMSPLRPNGSAPWEMTSSRVPEDAWVGPQLT